MGNWRRRRQGCEIYDQEVYRVRSDNRRPSQEVWKSTVPSWEKKFCSSVSSFSWNKFLENKRYVHLYKNILEWDDLAGKEAFDNAKRLFWANINHLPCNISLPDPNVHIDFVDWDAAIDLELYIDLEKKPTPVEEDSSHSRVQEETKHVFLCEALLLDPTFACTGWGDEEDPEPQVDTCENEVVRDQSGWVDYSNEWGQKVNHQQGRNYYEGTRNYDGRGGFGTYNGGSRHKVSRYPSANGYQPERGNRGRWKKVNVANEKHQWNMKPCAPPVS